MKLLVNFSDCNLSFLQCSGENLPQNVDVALLYVGGKVSLSVSNQKHLQCKKNLLLMTDIFLSYHVELSIVPD